MRQVDGRRRPARASARRGSGRRRASGRSFVSSPSPRSPSLSLPHSLSCRSSSLICWSSSFALSPRPLPSGPRGIASVPRAPRSRPLPRAEGGCGQLTSFCSFFAAAVSSAWNGSGIFPSAIACSTASSRTSACWAAPALIASVELVGDGLASLARRSASPGVPRARRALLACCRCRRPGRARAREREPRPPRRMAETIGESGYLWRHARPPHLVVRSVRAGKGR